MNLAYYSTYNAEKDIRRFYATMELHVEQPDVGQDVYMYLSFFKPEGTRWDVARCYVPYDGNVNLPYRLYEVTDHSGSERPYYGGLET